MCSPNKHILFLCHDFRLIQVVSNNQQYHEYNLVSEGNRFGFNQTEAMVNRVKSLGCMFDEE